MMLQNEWLSITVAVLAAWRVTHLFTKEDGPFDIIYLIRKKAGAGFFGSLLDCFYCMSLWVALPLAFFIGSGWKEILMLWLGISGAACLLEQLTTKPWVNHKKTLYSED